MKNTKRNMAKIKRILAAWKKNAPDAKFAKMTAEEFEAAIKPALDSDSRMLALETEQVNERRAWVNNCADSLDLALHVVDGVKADTTFGPDSPLYSSMGYIGKSARKSGLTRKGEATAQNTETLK